MKTSPTIWTNPIHFLAFGFGIGTIPKAPGTFGTLLAIPLYLVLQDFSPIMYLTIVLVGFLAGIAICDVTARDLKVPDHPGIVWDEIIGFLVTMYVAPTGWGWVILGFLLFRLTDITKPWPIATIDRKVKGGFGIMLDDLLAGVYAWLGVQIVVWVLT